MTTSRLPTQRDDSGFSTVELAVALVVTAILASVMFTWIFSVYTADDRHLSNDRAIEDLRTVVDQLSREVRSAEHLTAVGDKSLSYWLDSDRDDVQEPGETITWTIQPDGGVIRSTDTTTGSVLAQKIDYGSSQFSYDSSDPVSVARVTISLVASAGADGESDTAGMETDVYLRNA
jgi:type II secretory pathway pseudopilin PulG